MKTFTNTYWIAAVAFLALLSSALWHKSTGSGVAYIATIILAAVLWNIAGISIGNSARQRTVLAEIAIKDQKLESGELWKCTPNHKGATITFWDDVPKLSLKLNYYFRLCLPGSKVPVTARDVEIHRIDYLAEKARLAQTQSGKS